MGIKLLYSNEERRVLFYVSIYYLFVIKIYILSIFMTTRKTNHMLYVFIIHVKPVRVQLLR
jgi:hypothetical protein